jgi:peptide/nickel transport system substrate-binding protein
VVMSATDPTPESKVAETDVGSRYITRREALRQLGLGIAVAGVGGVVAGCGTSTKSGGTSSTSAAALTPRRGGTLTAALTGGASSDIIGPPWNPLNPTDTARFYQLYNQLIGLDNEGVPALDLATEISSNPEATEWTIRVRDGVTFHNGKTLGAEDVLYTFRQIVTPKSPQPGALVIAPLDLANAKILDRLTVRIPTHAPYAILPEALATGPFFFIAPVGFDVHKPVGTGPFRYQSFTPGQQSVFTKNPDYWQSGLPYVDKVVITDYSDETSQVNALLGGQADLIQYLSYASIGSVTGGGGKLLIAEAGGWTPFTMRADQPPFNDVRVRQAFRLIVNRPEMRRLVFGGYGTIGNDLYSLEDPLYDHQLPQREQDLGQAKSLLKAAGREGLTVTLVSSPVAPGMLGAATIFKQQAIAAGVTVNVRNTPVTEFYGPNYTKWIFAQDWWTGYPYLTQVASGTLPTAPYNETHFYNPRFIRLYREAISTTDGSTRLEIAHEMQTIEYDTGGYIIPYFYPVIDGYAAHVMGTHPAKTGQSFGNYDFKHMWLTTA